MAVRFLRAAALVCSLGACTIEPEGSRDSASTHTEIENGGSTNIEQPPTSARAGSAGRAGSKPNAKGGGSSVDNSGSGGRGGDADTAGIGGAGGEGGAPPPPCDLNGNCSSDGDGATVTCGVVPGNECEFTGFVGATAQLAWGKSQVIGLACCGQCECVPVEVYFDGAQCWQGIPQCAENRFITPHAATTPNPSFTPNTYAHGSFYLGSGGFGGSASVEGNGGSGGTSAESVPSAGSGGKHDHDDNDEHPAAGHAGCAAESAPTSVTP